MDVILLLPLQHLVLAFVLCLAISALGFLRVDWFISIGYGFSIAAQAVLFLVLYRDSLSIWTILQSALLLSYGARLGIYLVARERSPSFGRELQASKERGARVRDGLKLVIWISVSLLYVAMFAPALLSLWHQSRDAAVPSAPYGVLVMIAGLTIEALADWQKSVFKARHPSRFANTGLYRLVRYPNYFGEMVFWLGTFVSGLSSYQSVAAWLLSIAGFISIQLVMLGSTRRLELKQAERYGDDESYMAYVAGTPVLFPFVPLYSVKANRIYLG